MFSFCLSFLKKNENYKKQQNPGKLMDQTLTLQCRIICIHGVMRWVKVGRISQ